MISSLNGNSYSDWGMPALPGFGATTQAMRALTANSNALYGGDVSPILDVVSLGNPFSTGFDDVLAMKDLSRRMAAQRNLGSAAPADLLTMPTDQFLNLMAGQLSALKSVEGAKSGQAGKGKEGKDATSTNSPLTVKAHERYDSEGKAIPVTSTVTSEAGMGKWGTREYSYNPSGLNEADSVYGKAQLGKYYNVTVTWADGQSQTTQVQDKGWAIDVY